MSANTNPIFVLTPNSLPGLITVANLTCDGSGTLVTILTAGTNGSRVDQVVFRNSQATQAASSAMRGVVFLTDAAGANPMIVGEVLLAATTRSATVLGATGTVTFSPALTLKQGQILKACISIHASAADDTVATAFGGDF